MNIVVIHEGGVENYKSWTQVKKATSYEKDEFTQLGVDYLLNTTGDTYEIAKDIKQLERVASSKVFTKDKFDTTNWLQAFTLIIVLIMYLNGGGGK